jgi:hypothetical protein
MFLTPTELSNEMFRDKFWVGDGGGLQVLVVAGSDARNALHAAGVPELNNEIPYSYLPGKYKMKRS